ncbi:MAG: hypothetical protein CMF27_00390 [Kiritimatiellaceae bacterium]|nr:hypothetical protein [Kiritimatiellaceae bacterium]
MEADENGLTYHQGHDEEGDDAHVVLVPVGEVGAVDVMVGGVDNALNEPDEYGHGTVNEEAG